MSPLAGASVRNKSPKAVFTLSAFESPNTVFHLDEGMPVQNAYSWSQVPVVSIKDGGYGESELEACTLTSWVCV